MSTTTGTESRPFNWFDAFVLIVAAFVAIALSRNLPLVHAVLSMESIHLQAPAGAESERRSASALYYPAEDGSSHSASWVGLAAFWAQRIALWPCPALTSFTVTLFALAFLPRPHSRRRHWRTRPGLMAGLAFIVALTGTAALYPQTLMVDQGPGAGWMAHWREWWIATCFGLPRAAALAVAVSWFALGLTGRWRVGAGWLNQAGAIVGACWIFLGVVSGISTWLTLLVR